MHNSPYFSCRNLTCAYEKAAAVIENISLALPEKSFAALVGASGVGKTTLFRTLAGLMPPADGRVILDGRDITGKAGEVGYMPQKDMLLPFRTVLDNTILPLVIQGAKKKAARKAAASLFGAFGLSGFENRYPHELSGGMRQRAALLRTCMTHCRVILLDEPFSALDALTRTEMQAWYAQTACRLGLSTFLITHDIDEAVLLAGTVYILAGHPAQIRLRVDIPRPAPTDFHLSAEFLEYKQQIRAALG